MTPSRNIVPPLVHEADHLRFFIPQALYPSLSALPWMVPLDEWEGGGVRLIPAKSGLYVEIMEHKNFMSQKERHDVGLVAALEDYAARFGSQQSFRDTIRSITKALVSFFRADPFRSSIPL